MRSGLHVLADPQRPCADGAVDRCPNPCVGQVQRRLLGDVEDQYAELDKKYMEQAVWAPYGNERFTTFVSDRVDFDALVWSIVFAQDYSTFQLTD